MGIRCDDLKMDDISERMKEELELSERDIRIQNIAFYIDSLDWKTEKRYDWMRDSLLEILENEIELMDMNCCPLCKYSEGEIDDYEYIECTKFKLLNEPWKTCKYFEKKQTNK